MRLIGVVAIGLFAGVLVGFVLNEAIAVVSSTATGEVPSSRSSVLGLRPVVPALGLVGALLAVLVDRGRRKSS